MNKLHFGGCLDELKNLVDLFKENIDDYKSSRYDEENTKIDFIDKFFKLLGWDMYNDEEYSEDFREVVREDKVLIKGRPKSPDYSFKIGKERQFFVEAKKPSVNIYKDVKPAFQVRRYAYSAGLPISILTDFEEFAIYDTKIKPLEADKASVARIFYCKFDEYIKNFDFLNNTISKQAVWQGKLKKYTTDSTKKKGTQSVDKELLKLIETWRTNLAKNIALRNIELDIYQLNEAVQKIIDRIIFLRMAEDRNTEVYNTLKTYSEQKNIYEILVKYFTNSNTKYNSGLFAIVDWLDKLIIDDKIFKEIITDLYYPNPYEFSVLPIEILGQIYEQFLGKTIRLTQGHQAKVEEKPEVRKAGGVYYTPQYIVDYIVVNTVGKKIGDANSGRELSGRELSGRELKLSVAEEEAPRNRRLQPSAIEKLRVLDPACGSGSFLVGAFKYLLNYHLEYYTDEKRKAKALKDGAIYQVDENTYRLTIREKRKILLNNIYGVDIDPQAVEVTKLSLLLKLMEGEIVESRGELFLKSISEALLPDLKDNIKCGNSLIGTDFYHEKDMQLFDMHEQRKINCFDWEEEFPEIFHEKQLKAFHVTWVTHNSRLSERMIRVRAIKGEPFEMDTSMRDKIVGYLEKKILEMQSKMRALALNVLPDHVHLLMVCDEEEITEIARQLKGYSSHELCRELKLSVADSGRQNKIWAKSFSKTDVKDQKHLYEAIEYINNNHEKHEYPPCNRRLQPSAITKPEEAFEPMKSGGFDCVIGNPPWVFTKYVEWGNDTKNYIQYKYLAYTNSASKNKARQSGKINLYAIFIMKSLILLNKNGNFGFITPNNILRTTVYDITRKYILDNSKIEKIVDLKSGIFEGVTASTILLFLTKGYNSNHEVEIIYNDENSIIINDNINKIKQSLFEKNISYAFNIYVTNDVMLILDRISKNKVLSYYCKDIIEGIVAHKELIFDEPNNDTIPLLTGKNVKRYWNQKPTKHLIWDKKQIHRPRPDYLWNLEQKIIIQRISGGLKPLVATLDKEKYKSFASTNIIVLKDEFKTYYNYLLALINSNVLNFYYSNNFSNKSNLTVNISKTYLENLPIPDINDNEQIILKINKLVEQMLEAQKEAHSGKSTEGFSRRMLQQRIDIIDKQIDRLVYELYGLTEEEIGIVEEV